MAIIEAFGRVEREFKRLKDQLAAGQMTREQHDAALKELMVQDAQGRYWTIGANSGKWYMNDGTKWVEATPPQEPAASVPPTPPAAPVPPAWSVAPAPTMPSSSAKSRSRKWVVIIVGLVLVLCLCLCLVYVLTSPFGAMLNNPRGFLPSP